MLVDDFEVLPTDVDETPIAGESPSDMVARLASAKARAASLLRPQATVIGSDTTVALDGVAIGKPVDDDDARRTLGLLSGRVHLVHTAVAVVSQGARTAVEVSTTGVAFAPLGEAEIEWYVGTGEPRGKAGAYAIQGAGGALVERVDGDPSTVVGLPLRLTRTMLVRGGWLRT